MHRSYKIHQVSIDLHASRVFQWMFLSACLFELCRIVCHGQRALGSLQLGRAGRWAGSYTPLPQLAALITQIIILRFPSLFLLQLLPSFTSPLLPPTPPSLLLPLRSCASFPFWKSLLLARLPHFDFHLTHHSFISVIRDILLWFLHRSIL